jgi:hypothetical protein
MPLFLERPSMTAADANRIGHSWNLNLGHAGENPTSALMPRYDPFQLANC